MGIGFTARGLFSPFLEICFGYQTVFPQPITVYLVVDASVVLIWTVLEWKWGLSWLDKLSGRRNLINLNSTGREGMV